MALGNSHILGPPVETLYFDVLQFLYHLALAVLVGGSLALGTAAAPAIFAGARSGQCLGVIGDGLQRGLKIPHQPG